MNFKKISELSSLIVGWEKRLGDAKGRKVQAENDISIAKREISTLKSHLSEIIKEAD